MKVRVRVRATRVCNENESNESESESNESERGGTRFSIVLPSAAFGLTQDRSFILVAAICHRPKPQVVSMSYRRLRVIKYIEHYEYVSTSGAL